MSKDIIPEDIRFMIACYLFDDVKNLQQVEEFQNILNKDHIWKIWWETFIGGDIEESYKASVKRFLINIDPGHDVTSMFYCMYHGHDIYLASLLKKREYKLGFIAGLYCITRKGSIKNVLSQYVGGKDVMEDHVCGRT